MISPTPTLISTRHTSPDAACPIFTASVRLSYARQSRQTARRLAALVAITLWLVLGCVAVGSVQAQGALSGLLTGKRQTEQPAPETPPSTEGRSQGTVQTEGGNHAGDPSYSALADVLEDEAARAKLIQQLRDLASSADSPAQAASSAPANVEPARTASGNDASANATPATPATAAPAATPAATATASSDAQTRRGPATGIASRLQTFADEIKEDLDGSWRVVSALLAGRSAPDVSLQRWVPALVSLGVAIAAAFIAYVLLRLAANVGFSRINRWIRLSPEPQTSPAPSPRHYKSLRHLATFARGRKLLGVILAMVLDLAASILAGLAGYAVVIAFTQPGASVSLFAMQFLTAFVMIEAVKAVSRGIFATRHEHLRLIPVSSATAQFWHRWLSNILTITGYALLVVVPVFRTLLTPAVGELLGLLIMTAVYLYAVRVVWRQRQAVRDSLIVRAGHMSTAVFGTLLRVLARTWHWLVLAYLTVLFVVSQTRHQEALGFMSKATVQTLLAVLLGAIAMAVLSHLANRRIHLTDSWNKMLPSLETRLNAYVPTFLLGLRFLVLILVALIVLDAWQAFNLVEWLSSPGGQATISIVIRVGIILLIAVLGWTTLASLIEHRLGGSGRRLPTEREKTLLMLFRNAAAITIATMTVLVVLSQIGIDIGPLIAGAGVAGLAIGFGAQKLVQDVITGVFIQLENGLNQNDVVEVAGLFGTVEKVTIRTVALRTLDGGYHLIPFSAIDKVSNHTRDFGYHYAEYLIAHRESVDEAIKQLHLAFDALMQDPEMAAEVLEDISIPGVTSINQHGLTIRVMIKTTPGNQWMIQRAFNRLVKEHFDAAGIEVPYPQTVLHFGRDKEGKAAPLDIRHIRDIEDAFNVRAAPGQTRRIIDTDGDAQTLAKRAGTHGDADDTENANRIAPDQDLSRGKGAT